MSKLTVMREFQFSTATRGQKRVRGGRAPAVPPGGAPRVAKLMALAIRFDQLIREGRIADQAELARLGRVTRARLTQIMNMLNLAPEIQEQLLHLPPQNCNGDAVSERRLRPIAAMDNWQQQRHAWGVLRASLSFLPTTSPRP